MNKIALSRCMVSVPPSLNTPEYLCKVCREIEQEASRPLHSVNLRHLYSFPRGGARYKVVERSSL